MIALMVVTWAVCSAALLCVLWLEGWLEKRHIKADDRLVGDPLEEIAALPCAPNPTRLP